MEEKLENYCMKIAVLSYSRYYIYFYDIDIDVVEKIDDKILTLFEEMFQELEVEKYYSLFRNMFWETLKANSEWQKAKEEFGKDFSFMEDYINEVLDR